MTQHTAAALRNFTTRYCQHWQQHFGHAPASSDLYGVPSPCALEDRDHRFRAGDRLFIQSQRGSDTGAA